MMRIGAPTSAKVATQAKSVGAGNPIPAACLISPSLGGSFPSPCPTMSAGPARSLMMSNPMSTEREPVALFTNSEGRFGATGLAPGRWRITLTDAERTSFEIEIAEGQEGTLSIGELRPATP